MMSTTINDACANCGREGNNLNTCNKCELVKYCNAACKKKHRSKHKKKCDRHVAELHDEALFKQPPLREEDCPICFMRMPSLDTGRRYQGCCGKVICGGCFYAGAKMDGNVDQLCPFCRTPAPKMEEEAIQRIRKRVEVGDAQAMCELGCDYAEGNHDFLQDMNKALALWRQSAELGYTKSCFSIGNAHDNGRGVERDVKKAKHYYEIAAMGGNEYARHNLGCDDGNAGSIERALKHFMIAVGSGHHHSLKSIKQLCKDGHATRDDYAIALKAYQAYLEEIKSDQRDKAAAFSDGFKYYE